jgi:hypothetical protein
VWKSSNIQSTFQDDQLNTCAQKAFDTLILAPTTLAKPESQKSIAEASSSGVQMNKLSLF